jgi:hypothetical protein
MKSRRLINFPEVEDDLFCHPGGDDPPRLLSHCGLACPLFLTPIDGGARHGHDVRRLH